VSIRHGPAQPVDELPALAIRQDVLATFVKNTGVASTLPVALQPGIGTAPIGAYIPADFDASEEIVHLRARPPVCRTLWQRGRRVRADVNADLPRLHRAAYQG
jgi:hypothetical protein